MKLVIVFRQMFYCFLLVFLQVTSFLKCSITLQAFVYYLWVLDLKVFII